MTGPTGRVLRLLAVLATVGGIGLAGSVWAAETPKRRSSSPEGIAVSGEAWSSAPSGNGSAAMSASAGVAQNQTAGSASQYSDSVQGMSAQGGPVKVDGNTTSNATGSNISTTSTGRGNRGCTSVGGIAGGGC